MGDEQSTEKKPEVQTQEETKVEKTDNADTTGAGAGSGGEGDAFENNTGKNDMFTQRRMNQKRRRRDWVVPVKNRGGNESMRGSKDSEAWIEWICNNWTDVQENLQTYSDEQREEIADHYNEFFSEDDDEFGSKMVDPDTDADKIKNALAAFGKELKARFVADIIDTGFLNEVEEEEGE